MFYALRILLLLLALLLAGVLDASAYATRNYATPDYTAQNRVWENFSSLPDPRPELALQVLEPQQEIWVLIYDPASGSTVWTKFDPEGLFWSAVITAGFAAYDTYQYASGQISGAEYAGAMALNGAALVADVATVGQGGGLAVRAASVGIKVAKAVDKADTAYSAANGAIRTAESIAAGDGLGAVVNGALTAAGAKGSMPGGSSAKDTAQATQSEVASQFRGGVHAETKLPVGDGLDSHHMPAKSVSGIPAEQGPAIQMDPSDHRLTSSHGSQPGSAEYRAEIGQKIQDGDMRGAMATEIRDVRSAAQKGSGDQTKYNGATREMMQRARQDGHIPDNPKREKK